MNEEWGTYLPSLMKCLLVTKGDILEVGMGNFSTPILYEFGESTGRKVISLEDNPEWGSKFNYRCKPYDEHFKELFELWPDNKYSVVLLDHSPGSRRASDALLFKDCAEYIIVHDFEALDIGPSIQEIIGNWSHFQIDKRFTPWTLILSQKEIP